MLKAACRDLERTGCLSRGLGPSQKSLLGRSKKTWVYRACCQTAAHFLLKEGRDSSASFILMHGEGKEVPTAEPCGRVEPCSPGHSSLPAPRQAGSEREAPSRSLTPSFPTSLLHLDQTRPAPREEVATKSPQDPVKAPSISDALDCTRSRFP